MFISVKRHEREKQDLIDAGNRLTDAILKSSAQGLFLLEAKDGIQPELSASMATLFRRQEFANLTFDKLISPLVTAKTLSAVRAFTARLLDATVQVDPAHPSALEDVEVKLANPDGSFETAHYAFDFHPVHSGSEPRAWLVRVSDITARVQQHRELEDLRAQMRTQGEILRTVLQAGGARFGAFLQRTDASMKTINAVLKKPAREQDAFRAKLEEALDEVDRVRRDAAAFKLSARSRRLADEKARATHYFETTSEAFFANETAFLEQHHIDVALIDGLHTYEQVVRDVENTLRFLRDDGVIFLHDCNPALAVIGQPAASYTDFLAQQTGPLVIGVWSGDVWKAIVYLRSTRPDLRVAVLQCDDDASVVLDGLGGPAFDGGEDRLGRITGDLPHQL